jgi:hypothetical protein
MAGTKDAAATTDAACEAACKASATCQAARFDKTKNECYTYTAAQTFQADACCTVWTKTTDCEIRTYGGNDAPLAPCKLPFTYMTKTYTTCTTQDSTVNKLWCATTDADYDKTKKWGYCIPNAPLTATTAAAAATTGTTTPPKTGGCTNTYAEEKGKGQYNGIQEATAKTLDACKNACNALPTTQCLGINWNIVTSACYILRTLNDPTFTSNDVNQYVRTQTCVTTAAITTAATTATTRPTTTTLPVRPGVCVDTFTNTAATAGFGGTLQNGVDTQQKCESECLKVKIDQCGSYDFFTSTKQCWLNKEVAPLKRTDADSTQYSRKACEASTAATACQDTFQEQKNTGTYNAIQETSADTKDKCQKICADLPYRNCSSFEFYKDPAKTTGNCYIQANAEAKTHTSAGSWSSLYTRIQCATTAAPGQTTAQTTAHTTANTTAVTPSTSPSRDCTSLYTFTVESVVGTERKEALGDIIGCRDLCNGVPLIDCAAFSINSQGKCIIAKGPALQRVTDPKGYLFVRQEDCKTTVAPKTTTLPACVDKFSPVAQTASYGGTLTKEADTQAKCQAECLKLASDKCGSFDYFETTKECWLNPSIKPVTRPETTSTHYTREVCAGTTLRTAAGTPGPTTRITAGPGVKTTVGPTTTQGKTTSQKTTLPARTTKIPTTARVTNAPTTLPVQGRTTLPP